MRICLAAAAMTLLSLSSAAAQSSWGFGGSYSSNAPQTDGDWVRCTNDNHEHPLERAIESCTRIIGQRDGRSAVAGALWYRAQLYEDQGQNDLAGADIRAARDLYDDMIEADRDEATGYNNRASVNSWLEDYDRALADYDRAIELGRDYTSPLIGRAQVLFRRGDFTGAMEAYDRASRLAARNYGTYPSIYSGKCISRAAARVELDQARRFCDRAVRNSDASAWALVARGYYRFMTGDLEGANADFTRAGERDAYSAIAVYGRGVVAMRQGRQAEGEADMARGLQMNRRDVQFYSNAGLAP